VGGVGDLGRSAHGVDFWRALAIVRHCSVPVISVALWRWLLAPALVALSGARGFDLDILAICDFERFPY
jgi:hypothetical protein